MLVTRYCQMLDVALDRRVHGETLDADAVELRHLSQQLGVLRATPRDVLDLHMAALEQICASGINRVKEDAYREEGQFLIMRLLGHMVSYYRNRAQLVTPIRNLDDSLEDPSTDSEDTA